MKNSITVLGMFLLLYAAVAYSSEELLAVVMAEQEAFEEGDCDKVESMLAKDLTFYANGRRMSREQVGKFCRTIKRPFGAGRDPIDDTTTPYMVSEDLGYTVRDFRWQAENGRIVHEVVTKIWSRGEQGWQIIHFQSTVVPERRKTQSD